MEKIFISYRQIKHIVFALLLISVHTDIFSQVTINGVTYTLNSSTRVATVYQMPSTSQVDSLVIPSTVNYKGENYNVKAIAENAFKDCKSLTSIDIPNSVRGIPRRCFSGCSNLETVTLGESTYYIDEYAFYNCSNLRQINFPDGFERIYNSAFGYCTSLKEIHLNATAIGNNAFSRSGLEKITFSPKLKSIGEYAFDDTKIERLEIPKGVTSIGKGFLQNCGNLKELTVPFIGATPNPTGTSENTVLGYFFSRSSGTGCKNKVLQWYRNASNNIVGSDFYFPDSLTKITVNGDCALYSSFNGCNNLKEIVLAGNIRTIGERCFYNNIGITQIDLPPSVRRIEWAAFENCENLERVSLPDSLQVIGESAFNSCTSLREIIIPSQVNTIGVNAFYRCTSLREVTIPSKVSSIDMDSQNRNNAFSSCTNLETIKILSNYITKNLVLEKLVDLYDADSLRNIIFDGEVSYIRNSFISNPKKHFQTISVGGKRTQIANYAFRGLKVDTLHLSKGLEDLGPQDFSLPPYVTYTGMEEDWNLIENNSSLYPDEFHYGIIIPGEKFEKDNIFYYALDTIPAKAAVIKGPSPYARNVYIPKSVSIHNQIFEVSHIADNAFGDECKLDTIFYGGNKVEWQKLLIGKNNDALFNTPIVYNYNAFDFPQENLQNRLYINNQSVCLNERNYLSIQLKNEVPINGFQFELELPIGFSVATDERNQYNVTLSSERSSVEGHDILEVSRLNNGRYLIICSSSSRNTFSGNDGTVLSIELMINDDLCDGEYQVSLNNISISDEHMTVYRTYHETFPLTLYSYTIGDVNGDSNISVTDAVGVISHILNKTPDIFNNSAADINGDGEITITDVVSLLETIIGKQ